LDDLKETRRYWKLKEKALDRAVLRTSLGRGYGLVRDKVKVKQSHYRRLRLPDFKTIGT
jgi:hypothetical protein